MSNNKLSYSVKLRVGDFTILSTIIVLGVFAVLSYFFFDARVILKLSQEPINWDKNDLMEAFKYLGKAWALIWCLLVWIWISCRLRPALIGLLALLILAPVVPSLKVVVGRARPREVLEASQGAEDNNVQIKGLSFPSGDTASTFAVAMALAGFVRWHWMVLMFAAGVGVGLLRLTCLAHYPSDVFSGAAIGIFSGWFAIYISRKWALLDSFQLNSSRVIVLLGVVVTIPFVWLFKGFNHFLIFLKTYVVLAIGIYLISKITAWIRTNEK